MKVVRPPRLARAVLRIVLHADDRECALADVEEEFEARASRDGERSARRWYRIQVRLSIVPSIERHFQKPGTGPAVHPDRTRRASMLLTDSQQAWRRLRSRPAVPILVVGLLTLAIGLTTAMFAVVDSVVLRPLPFPGADRLVVLDGREGEPPALRDAWRQSGAFEQVEAEQSSGSMEIETPLGPRREMGARVTPGVFRMLGVAPIRGRLFEAGDTQQTVVLSEILWRSAFDSDPSVLGRTVRVGEESALVVGVLPANFRFPSHQTRLWTLLDEQISAPSVFGSTYARLADLPFDDAQDVSNAIARRLGFLAPEQALRMAPLTDRMSDNVLPGAADHRGVVGLLFVSALLVFVVLCANAGSLLLAQSTARQRDFGVCTALGASRGRLVRQALLEHAALGVAGGSLGLGLAYALLMIADAVVPETVLNVTLNPIDIDVRTAAMAAVLALTAVITAGVLPAWLGTRTDVVRSLKGAERVGTPTRGARVAARSLLVGEIALACTLLLGAALLVRTLDELARADRGADTRGVLTSSLRFSRPEPSSPATADSFLMALERDLEALPGIEGVAISHGRPAPSDYSYRAPQPWLPDRPDAVPVEINVNIHAVRADYFQLYRIPILAGRVFEATDGPRDVIIGERFANLLWPEDSPLGRSFSRGATRYRVIGVARETTFPTLDPQEDRPEFYEPFGTDRPSLDLSVRCGAGCPAPDIITDRIEAAHPGVRVSGLRFLEDRYRLELEQPRTTAMVGLVFAALAVIVAAGGLFAVLSHAVSRRRREFGIRTAFGASPGSLRQLVLRDGGLTATLGIAAGAAVGWMAVRAFSAVHYGVTPADPLSWAAVITAIAVTTLAAAWRPAQQATRANPVELLREE